MDNTSITNRPKTYNFPKPAKPAPAITYQPDPIRQAEVCELQAAYYAKLAEAMRLLAALDQLGEGSDHGR